MSITRRQFLKWAGVAGLSAILPPIFDRNMVAFAELPPGEGYFLPTVNKFSMCNTCDGNCGAILRIDSVGVVREINGNPADVDGGRGSVCVKSQSAMRNLYDPDLLKWPLKRTNPLKGVNEDPLFVKCDPASDAANWTAAIDLIATKMATAKADYGAKSIVVLARPVEVDRHFVDALGTPNQLCHVDTCYLTNDINAIATFGAGATRTLTTEGSTYILCFGYDMPGKSKMPQLKSFLEAWDKGAKIVVFDPRISVTASMADEWFAIKPGTDLAVVLAMINVIITENLYDSAFVTANCYGFTDLEAHVIAQGYTPTWAAGISGIPAADITRIAREFANSERPFVPFYKRDAGGPNYANSDGLVRALYILNSLVGSIEVKGGYWWKGREQGMLPTLAVQYPTKVLYPIIDGQARVDGQHLFPAANTWLGQSGGAGANYGYKSKGSFAHLADGLERARTGATYPGGAPSYPVKVIISSRYNTNSFPNMPKLVAELCNPTANIFSVVADNVPNNLAWLADVVLPDTWWLEGSNSYGTTIQHSFRERLYLVDGVSTLYARKGKGSIFKLILAALRTKWYWGDPATAPSFDVDFTPLSQERMRVFGVAKGLIGPAGTYLDLVSWLNAHGGIWHNPVTAPDYTFPKTTSHKIELKSQKLLAIGHEALPTWHPKLTEAGPDELYLLTNHNAFHRMLRNCNDPLIMDLQPENFLYIHPDAANSVPGGPVVTGDYVNVQGGTGLTRKIRVKVTDGIRPDTAMTEHGYGSFSKLLTVAYNKGVNDGDFQPDRNTVDSLTRFAYNQSMGSHIIDNVIKILAKA
jgi:thiosulfate reductase/polysulfide reductase chain A